MPSIRRHPNLQRRACSFVYVEEKSAATPTPSAGMPKGLVADQAPWLVEVGRLELHCACLPAEVREL
jgi:hypothetical protein